MSTIALCTIATKSYLAHARVLARSYSDHHPGARVFVLLADRADGHFDPAHEPFDVLPIDDFPLQRRDELLFKYTPFELCNALKPFLLAHVLGALGFERAIYLDTDVLVTAPFDGLDLPWGASPILLTPHITTPYPDSAKPDERAHLVSGAHNAGFVAVSGGPAATRFLGWWASRLEDQCRRRPREGLFVDQKWLDLAPSLFEEVGLLRDPGFNVAYWNLHEREVRAEDGVFQVNGAPLRFFHFSGYDPRSPRIISAHQDRFALRELPVVEGLFREYHGRLLDEGWETAASWPYAFGSFDNGEPISDGARRCYLGAVRRERFGNPFSTADPGSFYSWWKPRARRRTRVRRLVAGALRSPFLRRLS